MDWLQSAARLYRLLLRLRLGERQLRRLRQVGALSYLFCSILYRSKDFDAEIMRQHLDGATQSFEGECFTHVEVRRGLEAIFYFAGDFTTKSAAFAAACELLLDQYGEEIKQTALESGRKKFEFYVWLSSDMSPFDSAMKSTADTFEGTAIDEEHGERVRVSPAGVEHRTEECPITPEQLVSSAKTTASSTKTPISAPSTSGKMAMPAARSSTKT